MKLTARQAPQRGGRSAVIAHPFGALGEPAFCRAVSVDIADGIPCAAPLPRESPSGAQSMLVPLPVSGPHRDNHPRSQGRHLSSSSPRSGH